MDNRYDTQDFEVEYEEDDFGYEFEDDDEYEFGEDDEEGELEFSGYEIEAELEDPEFEINDELDEPYQFGSGDEFFEGEEYSLSENDGYDGDEYELELSGENDEEIFGLLKKAGRGLKKLVRGGIRVVKKIVGPLLKKLGPIAARIVGGAIGGPAGAKIGGTIASAILREGELESSEGTEIEFDRDEAEFEAVGGDIEVFEDMEAAAEEIAEAESERRANRGLARLMRGATRLFGRNRRLRPVIPLVVRAALALVKTFRGNRKTRWAIRTIPLIIRRTLTRLARARKVDRKTVVLAMSRETAWVLANRRRAIKAMRGGHRRRRGGRRIRRGGRRRMNREELFI
jgi:hypothetical protein